MYYSYREDHAAKCFNMIRRCGPGVCSASAVATNHPFSSCCRRVHAAETNSSYTSVEPELAKTRDEAGKQRNMGEVSRKFRSRHACMTHRGFARTSLAARWNGSCSYISAAHIVPCRTWHVIAPMWPVESRASDAQV